ncbi:MAG: phosphate acyltransferase PlsX [Oscillospiraceae bacterium]|nr:phosphate acyltransferase PlsX [Oscillospiraceae bacterium]
MKFLLDAFGGDNSPDEVLKGALMVMEDLGFEVALVGNKEKILESADRIGVTAKKFEIINAADNISMSESPIEITRSKKESSMAVGLRSLSQGRGDAFISAGNSGALLVGTTLTVRRAKGVKRIAFSPILPAEDKVFMLIDGGANAECSADMLCQFGVLGSIYMEDVLKINKPRVGLLNIGSERNKGDELRHQAFELLSDVPINFIGNIEARDLLFGAADVVVTDGFTGNVVLKLFEGAVSSLMGKIKSVFKKNFKTKLGAIMIKREFESMKKQLDYNECGAAPLLGSLRPVFKVHGNAGAKVFKNAVILADSYIKSDAGSIMAARCAEISRKTAVV